MADLIESAFAGLREISPVNQEAVAAMLDKYNLRWSVNKTQLQLDGGSPVPYYALVREDNKKCLYVCKNGYTPFQNSQLGELLFRVAEKTGYSFHGGGSLEGGKKVYLQLDSLEEIVNLGKNRTTVKGYITGINSHDGTTRLKWGCLNFTICCKNTFLAASSMLSNNYKHTATIKEEVEISVKNVLALQKKNTQLFTLYKKMAETPISGKMLSRVVEMATTVDLADKERGEHYSTKINNKADRLLHSIEEQTAQKGNTIWGLFSGVTHFTTHVQSHRRGENAKQTHKYVGSGYRTDNEVFDYLTTLIK